MCQRGGGSNVEEDDDDDALLYISYILYKSTMIRTLKALTTNETNLLVCLLKGNYRMNIFAVKQSLYKLIRRTLSTLYRVLYIDYTCGA